MSVVVVDSIPVRATWGEILNRLGVSPGAALGMSLGRLVHRACTIAEPRVLYRVCRVRPVDDTRVEVDEITLESPTLRRHLGPVDRVIPYVVTSGKELWEWSRTLEAALDRLWADVIIQVVLGTALDHFEDVLRDRHGSGPTSSVHPGSVPDWPLEGQMDLFELLQDPPTLIGVDLTDGFFMIPPGTVSGLRFETRERYHRCELCSRSTCSNRMGGPTLAMSQPGRCTVGRDEG